MNKYFVPTYLLLLLWSISCFSQVSYRGTIGADSVLFFFDKTDHRSADVASYYGIYSYMNTPKPHPVVAEVGDKVCLFDLNDGKKDTIDYFEATVYGNDLEWLEGVKKNTKTGKKQQFKVALSQAVKNRDGLSSIETMQTTILNDSLHFIIRAYVTVDGIQEHTELLLLKNDKGDVFQKWTLDFPMESPYGLYNIGIDDFNFDGYADFSVFIASRGANMFYHYFLYDSNEHKYVLTDALSPLASPIFFAENKTIIESISFPDMFITNAYTITNNQLVVLHSDTTFIAPITSLELLADTTILNALTMMDFDNIFKAFPVTAENVAMYQEAASLVLDADPFVAVYILETLVREQPDRESTLLLYGDALCSVENEEMYDVYRRYIKIKNEQRKSDEIPTRVFERIKKGSIREK